MKIIETEIWEPVPDKPHHVRFVKGRKITEVFKELYASLKEMNLLPDEYFIISHRIDKTMEFPRDAVIRTSAQWGSNEGIYIDVDIVIGNERLHFVTGKTLDETSEGYDRMNYIAGVIYKLFAGEGYNSFNHHTSHNLQSPQNQREIVEHLFREVSRKALFDNEFELSKHLANIDRLVKATELLDMGGAMTEEEVKILIEEVTR